MLTGSSRRSAGQLASLLALWCQIFLATALVPSMLASDPLAGAPICHATSDGQQRQPTQPVHHDCALCVSCLAHASLSALPPQSLATPLPRMAFVRTPAARQDAPPPRIIVAAQPRGPPALT